MKTWPFVLLVFSVVLGACAAQQKSIRTANNEDDINTGITAGDDGEKLGQTGVFEVMELTFDGPQYGPEDTPARDIDFHVRFRHEGDYLTAVPSDYPGFWIADDSRSVLFHFNKQ